MRKVFTWLVLIMILFYSHTIFSKTEEITKADGHAWRGYHEYVKVGFALGFLAGANKAIEEMDPFIRQSYYEEKKVEELLPIYNITNTQLKEQLDAFYAKAENTAVPIDEAVIIICKELSPKKDVKLIEREKEIAKLPPAKQRVERIKDRLKTEIKKGMHPKYEVNDDKIIKKETKEEIPVETEKDVEHLWFDVLVPEESRVVEVEKVNYTPIIVVSAAALAIIGILLFLLIRLLTKERRGGSR